MSAPTLTATYQSAWTVTGNIPVTVTSSAGDVLVVMVVGADANTGFTAVSGNGVIWTQQLDVGTAGATSRVKVWTGTDATGGTAWTLTVTASIASADTGAVVYRFAGASSTGIGANASVGGTASNTQAITTTGANSALLWASGDWNAVGTGSTHPTWATVNGDTPTVGNGEEKVYAWVSGQYNVASAIWADVGAAGSKSPGCTFAGGTAQNSIGVIEVLGTAGGGGTGAVPRIVVGASGAAHQAASW